MNMDHEKLKQVKMYDLKCPKMTNCHCRGTTSCGTVMGLGMPEEESLQASTENDTVTDQ